MKLYQELNKEIDCYVMAISKEEKLYGMDIIQRLRLNGLYAEMDFLNKGLKGQFKQADRLNAKYLIILNDEDLKKGIVNIKDNGTKEEEKVDIDEVIEYIMGNI